MTMTTIGLTMTTMTTMGGRGQRWSYRLPLCGLSVRAGERWVLCIAGIEMRHWAGYAAVPVDSGRFTVCGDGGRGRHQLRSASGLWRPTSLLPPTSLWLLWPDGAARHGTRRLCGRAS